MLEFTSNRQAINWMDEQVDCPFMDNIRVGYYDDPASMAEYEQRESQGCCGFFSKQVIIAGRKAIIGCNYGH